MNHVTLIGRLTKDPETRYTNDGTCIAKYTLAVNRIGKDKGADFINCTAFGGAGEFAEKYLKKGVKVAVEGRIQTGSYKGKDGKTVYTTDVIISAHEFCEKVEKAPKADDDGFMKASDGVTDEELPFN